MDTLATRRKNKTEYLIFALLPVCAGLFAVLGFFAAMKGTDLAITLCAVLALAGIALLLRRLGLSRYAFIPVLLLLAVASYAALTLMSLGAFTYRSETHALLQVFGLLWMAALYFFLYALIGRLSPAIIAGGIASAVFGTANYAMLQFRGRLFLPGDVTALRTAANVADNYSLEISEVFALALLAEVLFTCLGLFLGRAGGLLPDRRWRLISRFCALLPTLAYAVFICGGNVMDSCGIRLTWNENDFEESPVLYFVESLQQLGVDKPEGYSADALDGVAGAVENASADTRLHPHVIVIMDEAFSDLRRIGDFETSVEITPFIDALTENTVKGYVYSSVYGGSTANSEFEFLTGCTMAFIPQGTTPYQQDIKYDKDTLVSVLETQGYTSMALHPYDASGWNREAVYDCFGFDSVHFIDDFQNKRYLRGYVSDESDFDNLIRYYEARGEDERMFLFNITMQNHGSYKTEGFASTVSVIGHAGEFPQTEQYLSLLRRTDTAVEKLIGYFSQQEDPVIILFFGDHQPDLEDAFYDLLYGKTADQLTQEEAQRKYLTPFFIWANYDIPEADLGKASINYLSPLLLEAAGLKSSDFEAYLLGLREKWPVINANGCVDASGQHLAADCDAVAADESLNAYRMLQYNFLFDTDGYRKDLFGLQ